MQIISHADYTTVILPKTVAISGGADELKSAMLTLCDQHCKNIVLDFSEANFPEFYLTHHNKLVMIRLRNVWHV